MPIGREFRSLSIPYLIPQQHHHQLLYFTKWYIHNHA